MKAIATMAENRAIGRNNKLPWIPIKEDFKWFKDFTTREILVVGSKTFDTLPPLRNRNVIILTKYSDGYEDVYDPIYNYAYCYKSYEDILEINNSQPNLICAGGAKTYELFLPYITEFYVTHIKGEYEADTFMPPFEEYFSKKQIIRAFNERLMVFSSSDNDSIEEETLKEVDGHYIVKYSKE